MPVVIWRQVSFQAVLLLNNMVMNALDIFKTLAAQGTQIFFTTANDQMVRLFKEAFQGSSLTYKEYYFTKRINGASLIQERHIHDPLPTEELS